MNTKRNPVSGEVKALSFATLPLWHSAATTAAPTPSATIPRAVRHIAAKGRISLTQAAVIAALMGFNSEASQ